jgi:DnaJ homolog subfamily C member 9
LQLTSEKIDEFSNKYRGSDSERQEVLETFTKCKGDMEALFERVTCSDAALDSHRFMDMMDAEIEAGNVESTKKYKLWKVAVSKKKRPKNPLKPKTTIAKKSEMESDAALVAAIQARVRFNLNQSAVQDKECGLYI